MTTKYYLIAPVMGDHVQVNEQYAPNIYGISLNFTAADIAKLCHVKIKTAQSLIDAWLFDGACKEVV